MIFNITDEMVSQFLSGIVPILVLIAVGSILSVLFKGMKSKFSFTQMALILALTPLSLVHFLEPSTRLSLYLFAMIIALLGITIDGINHLLMPKEQLKADIKGIKEEEPSSKQESEVIVWEKAE